MKVRIRSLNHIWCLKNREGSIDFIGHNYYYFGKSKTTNKIYKSSPISQSDILKLHSIINLAADYKMNKQ